MTQFEPLLWKQATTRRDAISLRSLGALYWRQGKYLDASMMLKMALERRSGEWRYPVEELLLALVHLEQNQWEEARRWYGIAKQWRESDRGPRSAARMIGLYGGCGWNGLVSEMLPIPDPRHTPAEWESRMEFDHLLKLTEQAMRK